MSNAQHAKSAADLDTMHRSPVTDCPHYGTRNECAIDACKRARAEEDAETVIGDRLTDDCDYIGRSASDW